MKSRTALLVLLAVLSLVFTSAQSFANNQVDSSPIMRSEATPELTYPDWGATLNLDTTPISGTVLPTTEKQTAFTLPARPDYPQGDPTCRQILANPQLDVVLIDPDTGFAEPWVEFPGEIYFSDVDYVSPFYSLLTIDGDPGDATPTLDGLAQAFFMPDDLISVRVDFATAAVNQNSTDGAQGELWTLNNDGTLKDFIDGFVIPDVSGNTWSFWFYNVQSQNLPVMSGQPMALIMFGFGNGASPGELTFLDDILLTACYAAPVGGPQKNFLPTMVSRVSTGPICSPPTENPPDQYFADRGYVETGATCNSTLAQTDKQDYYTYSPEATDTYRFLLSNLPTNSEWSVTVFEDGPNPVIANGGSCRTTDPGDGDKYVDCNLPGNGNFFIKISAGAWSSGAANYTLQVIRR